MKSHSILTALRSIRTQFGLVTACILLVLLSAFYLGGRFIVVQMIRQAEQDIQTTGNDIKSIVYGELVHLQQASDQSADELSRSADELTNDFLQSRLGSFSDVGSPINLAFGLTVGGTFKNGCALFPGEPLHLVEVSELQPYFSSSSPLPVSLRNGKSASGIIVFNNRPAFFAISPVKAPAGTLRGFIVLGSLLHNATLITRINAAARGMPVSLSNRPTGRAHATVAAGQQAGQTPVFQDILTYPSGGRWHLGENAFEEIIPINDILGREVAYISIRLPGSFASLASLALGWLTCFIACVGIVFVLPIFWLQTRIVLNPLSNLTRQIRQLGEHHLDGDCEAIRWTKKDEFGLLAQSVNELLSALANKTQQHAQGEQRQRALIAGMPDCLCVFDNQANVVTIYKQPDYANPIPGLIAGRPLSPPLFPDTDCEALRIAIGETFTTDRIQMVIVSCRESDGSYRHFETRISRMDEFFVLVVLRDVTKEWREREAREQVEERLIKVQKMESLGTLAAGIAHDFNNILAIIQNTVDLIDESPDPYSFTFAQCGSAGGINPARSAGALQKTLFFDLPDSSGRTDRALRQRAAAHHPPHAETGSAGRHPFRAHRGEDSGDVQIRDLQRIPQQALHPQRTQRNSRAFRLYQVTFVAASCHIRGCAKKKWQGFPILATVSSCKAGFNGFNTATKASFPSNANGRTPLTWTKTDASNAAAAGVTSNNSSGIGGISLARCMASITFSVNSGCCSSSNASAEISIGVSVTGRSVRMCNTSMHSSFGKNSRSFHNQTRSISAVDAARDKALISRPKS